MTIDHFEPRLAEPYAPIPDARADAFYRRIDAVARRLRIEVDGIEKLPRGRALIVANHALGWDVVFAINAIRNATGRRVYALGEHLWWKVPYLRSVAVSAGVVDGTRENADELLAHDELVLVLPGGLREAIKPSTLRYRLLWGERYGFVRAAMKNRAPMVPLAALGADEVFHLVGDAMERGRRWLGPIGLGFLPLPRPAFGFPWPHRAHLRYAIGDPIDQIYPPELANDPKALRNTRLLVEGALHELIDRELARREHVSTSHGA